MEGTCAKKEVFFEDDERGVSLFFLENALCLEPRQQGSDLMYDLSSSQRERPVSKSISNRERETKRERERPVSMCPSERSQNKTLWTELCLNKLCV